VKGLGTGGKALKQTAKSIRSDQEDAKNRLKKTMIVKGHFAHAIHVGDWKKVGIRKGKHKTEGRRKSEEPCFDETHGSCRKTKGEKACD